MIDPTETQTQWSENAMRERIAELEATRNELMATVEQVVGRLDKANGELAKYKWMTRQGLIAEYGAQQLDAEYEAQLMGLLETEYVARAEEGEPRLGRDERLRMGLTTAEVMRRLKHDGYNPAPRAEEGGE